MAKQLSPVHCLDPMARVARTLLTILIVAFLASCDASPTVVAPGSGLGELADPESFGLVGDTVWVTEMSER
ncbi:MAG: hypothetical protein ACRENP_17420 [Longimicrobiales bacterium]